MRRTACARRRSSEPRSSSSSWARSSAAVCTTVKLFAALLELAVKPIQLFLQCPLALLDGSLRGGQPCVRSLELGAEFLDGPLALFDFGTRSHEALARLL